MVYQDDLGAAVADRSLVGLEQVKNHISKYYKVPFPAPLPRTDCRIPMDIATVRDALIVHKFECNTTLSANELGTHAHIHTRRCGVKRDTNHLLPLTPSGPLQHFRSRTPRLNSVASLSSGTSGQENRLKKGTAHKDMPTMAVTLTDTNELTESLC